MTLRIKGWEQFQHFKDRRPPWIKLYRDILDDPDWHELSDKASKHLVMFWLIASENEGYLPELKKLAFRLRTTEKSLIQVVSELSHWLDNTTSERYRDDAPEGEGDGEGEVERETETEGSAAPQSDPTPPVVSIPLNDKTEFEIRQPMIDEWNASYQAVNVLQQLRQMRSWCLANPANRKTRRGVESFIVRWLGKEQNKGSGPTKTFKERDTEISRKRWEEMTGQQHPDNLGGSVLDVFDVPLLRVAQ